MAQKQKKHIVKEKLPNVDVSEDAAGNSIHLSDRQNTLYRILRTKDVDLANMYIGSIIALKDKSNPDSWALAAHGVRELMEKLPEILDLRIKAQKESLKVKVREIEVMWENALNNSICITNQEWEGKIDKHLIKLLKKMNTFFKWFNTHHPRRKAEIAKTLKELNGSGYIHHTPFENKNISAWDKIRNYFQGVAHHRKITTYEEYESWLSQLEEFLLTRMRPRTFDDFDAIDQIIAEGEKDD